MDHCIELAGVFNFFDQGQTQNSGKYEKAAARNENKCSGSEESNDGVNKNFYKQLQPFNFPKFGSRKSPVSLYKAHKE